MLITKKWLRRLLGEDSHQAVAYGYAESQTLTSPSSKVLMLLTTTEMRIYYLNFFQTKVIDQEVLAFSEIGESQLRMGALRIDYLWHLKSAKHKYRFRILRKIFPLAKRQEILVEAIANLEKNGSKQ